MAHAAQRRFCRRVKQRFPRCFHGRRVLEVGARNVNGSVRELFDDCRYVGLDCTAGLGVDHVGLAHDFPAEPDSFDVACACETFEHDPFADRTVAQMLRLLRPGGLFFTTCAGEGRTEHGTARTGETFGPDPHFYRNVAVAEFLGWVLSAAVPLRELHVEANAAACDLYAWAIKG